MRMDGQDESSNVEDVRGHARRRGRRIRHRRAGHRPRHGRVAVIAGWIFGINPLTLLGMMGGGEAPTEQTAPGPAPAPPANDAQPASSRIPRVGDPGAADPGAARQAGRTSSSPVQEVTAHSPVVAQAVPVQVLPFHCPGVPGRAGERLRLVNVAGVPGAGRRCRSRR